MRDLWHIGELPGDDGRAIRDGNGLLVAEGLTRRDTAKLVEAHNSNDEELPFGGLLLKVRNFLSELQHDADPEAADLLVEVNRALERAV